MPPHNTHQKGAAWVAGAAAASLGYLVYTGVEVRAYGIVLLFGSLSLWMTLRWMRQPDNWRRVLLLAVVLALTFYSTFTSVLYIAFLSLLVVVLRPRLFPRWVLVGGVTAMIALPAIIQFIGNAAQRLDVMPQPPKDFLTEMVQVYTDFGGTSIHLVLMLGAVAAVVYGLLRRRVSGRWVLVLFIWLSVPAVIYGVAPNREYLNVRYVWWVSLGIVMLFATAAAFLPRRGQWAAVAVILATVFIPVDWLQFRAVPTEAVPMRMVLSWFARNVRPGDILIKDPYCVCGTPMSWDYFLPQFFPQGELPWATEPADHSRVWYLATTGWQQDEALKAEIMKDRKESIFVGPWNFLLRLYEGPPLWEGIAFNDTVALNGFEIAENRTTFRENETLSVKLWWSALQPPPMDYSISLTLLDEDGNIVVQSDGPANAPGTPEQMTAWQPGAYYEDYRTLQLPKQLAGRHYNLTVTVYDWQTGERLVPAANEDFEVDTANRYLLLKTIEVVSY
ncbi:MAG: hypothetical protein LCI00_27705 [Chloroflexi bacterium]|nr:hypothetical protein [Chloroflexota bacterium]